MKVTIDIEKMTIGDLETCDKASRGEATLSDMIAVLAKLTDADVRALPVTRMKELTDALTAAVDEATNPKAPEGN